MSSLRRRSYALLLAGIMLLSAFTLWSATRVHLVKATPSTNYEFTDLSYLASHLKEFDGLPVATRGVVKFYASIYMYEDFWLQAQGNSSVRIPVVVRFAGLAVPREGSLIAVSGIIEYCNLEGGFFYLNASSWTEVKNVILIGWDGVQRNHLFELINRGILPSLQAFLIDGKLVNVTLIDHRTDTKSGWTQTLTGYRWWKTGVYNNAYWFHSVPAGYTIPERVERHNGKDQVATAFITGKRGHMEAVNGTGTAQTGLYTQEAIYSNIPSQVDVCNVGDRGANIVGPLTLQFIENNSNRHFFAFFHFSDPDSAGHNQTVGGENSALYEEAIIRCDYWLGQILSKLKTLNIIQNTLLYITADHGFDEGGYSHNNAPFVFLATNDKNVSRNGDQVDVAPTVYYGLGMRDSRFDPALDGFPLQGALPPGEEQKRQSILADNSQPPKPSIFYPTNEAILSGTVDIKFNASDKYLSAVLLLINNTLKADGPWDWQNGSQVEAQGSYKWETTSIPAGPYEIKILAFDEHGANNSPSISTITVNVVPWIPILWIFPTLPSEGSIMNPPPSTPPNNEPTVPPITPPPDNAPKKPQMSSGLSLPMEYRYVIAVSLAFILATIAARLYSKRKKELE